MSDVKTEIIKDYYNQSQAAIILGVTRMTIWNWLNDGSLSSVIVGGFRMIPRSEIERIIKERKKETAGH